MNEPSLPSSALLFLYGAAIILASLAGGWVLLLVRLTHKRLQIATSFVAGLMLGVGLLHLLPHAFTQLHSLDRTVAWLMGGFLTVFFIQRFFHFHHHDVEEDSHEDSGPHHDHGGCEHEHGEEHGVHASLADESARRLSWTSAMLGLGLHTLIDGAAVAASVLADVHTDGHGAIAGPGTFLVVCLHKPFDAMAVGALMARGGHSRSFRHLINALLALGIPAGMLLFYFGFSQSPSASPFLGATLAFSAGTFLCISASDLLPELQFHAHDRWTLSFALLAGLAIAAALGHFETSGHDSHEEQNVHPSAGQVESGTGLAR